MECLLIWKSSILGITTNIKFQGKTVYQRFRALMKMFPTEKRKHDGCHTWSRNWLPF